MQALAAVDHGEERQHIGAAVGVGEKRLQLVECAHPQRGRDQRHEQRAGRLEDALRQQGDAGRAVEDDDVEVIGQGRQQLSQGRPTLPQEIPSGRAQSVQVSPRSEDWNPRWTIQVMSSAVRPRENCDPLRGLLCPR